MRITRVVAVVAVIAAIAAPAALAFGFTDGHSPPSGTVGVPYSFKFVADGGCPPYNIVLKSGALPSGLSLDSGGTLSGTPTSSGVASFWLEVRDTGCGPSATCPPAGISCSNPSQRPFSIEIGSKLTVTTGPLAPATVGTPYAVKLTADGGGSQSWSIVSGALPAGLALGADGTLSGTPTADVPEPVVFTVKVTDGSRSDTKNLQLDVVKPLAVTPVTLAVGEVGHPLKPFTVTATGGRAPYAPTVTGQPEWLTFDPTTGFSGTPEAAGTFPFQVSFKDAYGSQATANLVLVVKPKVVVKTVKLTATKVGKNYRIVLRSAGGVAPFTWRVTSGKFPVGIRLDRKKGLLSGKPRKAGIYPLTFTVTDSLGETSEVSLKLNVAAVKVKKK